MQAAAFARLVQAAAPGRVAPGAVGSRPKRIAGPADLSLGLAQRELHLLRSRGALPTVVSKPRVVVTMALALHVMQHGPPGDLVEAGVFKGRRPRCPKWRLAVRAARAEPHSESTRVTCPRNLAALGGPCCAPTLLQHPPPHPP